MNTENEYADNGKGQIEALEKMSSPEIVQSKWKQNQEGDWMLFFNNDDLHEISEIDNLLDKHKIKTNNVKFVKIAKKLRLGCKVMTPVGIGTCIKVENKDVSIKLQKEEKVYNFDESVVLPEFPLYLRVLTNEFGNWYRLTVPANGDIISLRNLIDTLGVVDSADCDYSLISKGVELHDSTTFEHLDFRSEDKILLCGMKKVENKISRFTNTSEYWYANPDAIVFSVNKRIKLTAVSLYISMENLSQPGKLTISEVEEDISRRRRGRGRRNRATNNAGFRENILFEQSATVSNISDRSNCIFKIVLDKPVTIKAHFDYKIEFSCTSSSELYYGTGGNATISGDKNVEFYFKSAYYESSAVCGNFPELYYYL